LRKKRYYVEKMYNHILYFTYWLFNSSILFIFSYILPGNIVLGNWRFGPLEAAVYAGFWVTFFVWILWDFAMAKGLKFDSKAVTLGYFWAANMFAFWIVSRFSQYTGLGITNYFWAIVAGFGGFLVQRLAWRLIVKSKSSKSTV